jgi:hypothetical protein
VWAVLLATAAAKRATNPADSRDDSRFRLSGEGIQEGKNDIEANITDVVTENGCKDDGLRAMRELQISTVFP